MSYASADLEEVSDWVELIKSLLEELEPQLPVFFSPTSIRYGDDFQDVIKSQINRCHVLFAWVSERFLRSGWTNYEVGYAQCAGVRVIPIKSLSDRKWNNAPSFIRCLHYLPAEEARDLVRHGDKLREALG